MPALVDVTRDGPARLRIPHGAQDARKTGLQHINNNHANATAKHSQTPGPRTDARRANPGN